MEGIGDSQIRHTATCSFFSREEVDSGLSYFETGAFPQGPARPVI